MIEDLFYQQVNYLADQNEILFENVFIDGTKIEANANRYTFVWKKAILKNEGKMFDKILVLLETIIILKSNKQIPYIKPQTYEKWKKRSFKNDISKRENMKYDAESDLYHSHISISTI